MSPQELADLKRLIVHVAEYYGRDLKPAVVTMMADDLADLAFDQVVAAYNRYRRESKVMQFPLPAQIRAMIQPEITPEAQGREVYLRITEAVRKFGYMQPEPAMAYIGPSGWSVVQAMGGWWSICSTDILSQASTMALIRERVADLSKFGSQTLSGVMRVGAKDQAPELAEQQRRHLLLDQAQQLANSKDINQGGDNASGGRGDVLPVREAGFGEDQKDPRDDT